MASRSLLDAHRSAPVVRVLVVDDHLALRDAAKAVIAATDGFEHLAAAASGEAALPLAQRLRPDLALVDVQLPGIGGTEVARRLRDLASPPVVILMSADEQLLGSPAAAACGAAATLPKQLLRPQTLRALWAQHAPPADHLHPPRE